MPMDAVCLQAVAEELRPRLLGVRIDKVQQPARDQVILLLRGGLRLLLGAGPASPRLQLTDRLRDNPMEPPMFCMLLRKHLVGGRVTELSQPKLERLVELTVEITDEMGCSAVRRLVLELMGRRSNLILLDGENRVIDCLHRVDAEMSAKRQVLPGLFYQYPPTDERRRFTEVTEEEFLAKLSAAAPEQQADAWLLSEFFGLSPLIARELTLRAAGETDRRLFELGTDGMQRLWDALRELQKRVEENRFTPVCLRQKGKPLDFSFFPITQYGPAAESTTYDSFSALLDDFYESREREERIRQRGQDLVRTATTARDRLRRKLALQEKDYAATQDRDKLRICGDLITANLYRMERGSARLTAENYYAEDGGSIDIPLDPLLTPQQNAAKYYKRYAKAKTAEKCLREQMELARQELAYLESVLEEIGDAETEQDFLEIRGELRDAGYLQRQTRDKKMMKRPEKPREFKTTAGLRVLVGRNNRQNDRLTLKDADRRDLWLHTQKIHGAHVILCTDGQEPDGKSVTEAAMIAAWFSQAKESGSVPVDVTPVRNVKKPAGALPGMVIYTNARTVYVTPQESLVKELRVR